MTRKLVCLRSVMLHRVLHEHVYFAACRVQGQRERVADNSITDSASIDGMGSARRRAIRSTHKALTQVSKCHRATQYRTRIPLGGTRAALREAKPGKNHTSATRSKKARNQAAPANEARKSSLLPKTPRLIMVSREFVLRGLPETAISFLYRVHCVDISILKRM